MYESLRPFMDKAAAWIENWDETGDDYQRKLYEELAEAALEAGEEE
jgi:translation initiation factor 3 subunit M